MPYTIDLLSEIEEVRERSLKRLQPLQVRTQARKNGKHQRVKGLLNGLFAEQRMFDDNKKLPEPRDGSGSDHLCIGGRIAALYGPEPRFRRPA